MGATRMEATAAADKLKEFISPRQLGVMLELSHGEEGPFFLDKLVQMAVIVDLMPETYETDGQGLEALVHLHYFRGGVDAWVTEKDVGDGSSDTRQHQAFGKACMTGDPSDAELGYISIAELIDNDVELDLHWTPKKLSEL